MSTQSQINEENGENSDHDVGQQTTWPSYTTDCVKAANSTSQASACAAHKNPTSAQNSSAPNDQWSEAISSLQKTLGVGDERFARGTLFQLVEACREKGDELNNSSLGLAI